MGKSRTVGKGRTVFAGGVRYDEGSSVPDDVEVGDHVFTDADPVEGNVAAETVKVAVPPSIDGDTVAELKVDDVLAAVGDDAAKAADALAAEQAKGDKARKTLVEKLQAIVDGSGS